MTDLIYLTDSYKKELRTRLVSVTRKGDHWELVTASTIFYPEGGGQPSDRGTIRGSHATAQVRHVRMKDDTVIHECSIDGTFSPDEEVVETIDWDMRYEHMRLHSAGHIVHEAVRMVAPNLTPLKGEHGSHPYIEYVGSLPIGKATDVESRANDLIARNVTLKTELVPMAELVRRVSYVPSHLPKNKPLRILTIGDLEPIPDGGTQVKSASEVEPVSITRIENDESKVRVYYAIVRHEPEAVPQTEQQTSDHLTPAEITRLLLEAESVSKEIIASSSQPADILRLEVLGGKSAFAEAARQIKRVDPTHRQEIGKVINIVKGTIEGVLEEKHRDDRSRRDTEGEGMDVTMPGIRPPEGHLHIVTQAITEITHIFERIGFTRVRHPEVDWDWYPFESLNMPPNHPARDEWETFFLDYPGTPKKDPRKQKLVLTPHTSNGQVREMEKGNLPIRMINIAKCYRRQIDVSHTPMFHQFEGLYVDRDVSIGNLKGVFDYFVKQFFGGERVTRLRPFHFQFTEPSFEVDINCGICLGTGTLQDGTTCKLCKAGWLELGGSGMVHPVVLRNGGIDPDIYSGFAFGWGIERTSMMKSGTKLDDIRLLYGNDLRFLQQF